MPAPNRDCRFAFRCGAMSDASPRRHTHLGAYAFIQRKDGAVLLIRKARGPYTGRWDLPGGQIEFGETPEEALRREVNEETGLQITDAPQLLAVFSHIAAWAPESEVMEVIHHLGAIYRASIAAGSSPMEAPDGEDAAGAEWLTLAALEGLLLTPFAKRTLGETGGSVWESNPPRTASPPRARF